MWRQESATHQRSFISAQVLLPPEVTQWLLEGVSFEIRTLLLDGEHEYMRAETYSSKEQQRRRTACWCSYAADGGRDCSLVEAYLEMARFIAPPAEHASFVVTDTDRVKWRREGTTEEWHGDGKAW
jgi:hypothetical protein